MYRKISKKLWTRLKIFIKNVRRRNRLDDTRSDSVQVLENKQGDGDQIYQRGMFNFMSIKSYSKR